MSTRLWYTLLMLAMAVLHASFTRFDTTSVWVGVAAAVPWILPELQGMIKSLKAGNLFDVEFRDKLAEQDEKIAVQQIAIETGVGKMPPAVAGLAPAALAGAAGAVSYEIVAQEEGTPAVQEAKISADPNKGQFGSKPSVDGLRLRAEVKLAPGSEELFVIHATVAAERGRTLKAGTPVTFYLHPTFPKPIVDTEVKSDGTATLDRVALGCFTLGAKVRETGKETALELDLGQDVPGAPAKFVSR